MAGRRFGASVSNVCVSSTYVQPKLPCRLPGCPACVYGYRTECQVMRFHCLLQGRSNQARARYYVSRLPASCPLPAAFCQLPASLRPVNAFHPPRLLLSPVRGDCCFYTLHLHFFLVPRTTFFLPISSLPLLSLHSSALLVVVFLAPSVWLLFNPTSRIKLVVGHPQTHLGSQCRCRPIPCTTHVPFECIFHISSHRRFF